jgi:hypothetical protein
MGQKNWPSGRLLALLLSAAAAATTAWAAAPGALVQVAESRSVADYDLGYRDGYNNLPSRYQDRQRADYAEGYRVGQARRQATGAAAPLSDDYVRGYGDGLNGKDRRERDRAYRDGYRAGRAQHEANTARADGRDYARGYRDGYNRFRERAAVPSGNRAYAAGFRAGQANHTTLVAGGAQPLPPTAALPPPPAQGENLVGRPAVALDRDMQSLSFVLLARAKKGKVEFTTWQSRSLNKCLRITAYDGKVQQVVDVDNTNCT